MLAGGLDVLLSEGERTPYVARIETLLYFFDVTLTLHWMGFRIAMLGYRRESLVSLRLQLPDKRYNSANTYQNV